MTHLVPVVSTASEIQARPDLIKLPLAQTSTLMILTALTQQT